MKKSLDKLKKFKTVINTIIIHVILKYSCINSSTEILTIYLINLLFVKLNVPCTVSYWLFVVGSCGVFQLM